MCLFFIVDFDSFTVANVSSLKQVRYRDVITAFVLSCTVALEFKSYPCLQQCDESILIPHNTYMRNDSDLYLPTLR